MRADAACNEALGARGLQAGGGMECGAETLMTRTRLAAEECPSLVWASHDVANA